MRMSTMASLDEAPESLHVRRTTSRLSPTTGGGGGAWAPFVAMEQVGVHLQHVHDDVSNIWELQEWRRLRVFPKDQTVAVFWHSLIRPTVARAVPLPLRFTKSASIATTPCSTVRRGDPHTEQEKEAHGGPECAHIRWRCAIQIDRTARA